MPYKPNLIEKGFELLSKGNSKEGRVCLLEALDKDGKTMSTELRIAVFCMLSGSYEKTGEYAECLRFFQKALSEEEYIPLLHSVLSSQLGWPIFSPGEKLDKAVVVGLEKDFSKREFGSEITLSVARYLAGDLTGMKSHLGIAKELKPDHPALIYCLARYHSAKREYNEAFILHDKLHSIRQEDSIEYFLNKFECFYFLALAEWKDGDTEGTAKLLEKGADFINDFRPRLERNEDFNKFFVPLLDLCGREVTLFREVISLDKDLQKIFEAKSLFQAFLCAKDAFELTFDLPTFSKIAGGNERSLFEFPTVFVSVIKAFCAGAIREAGAFFYKDKTDGDKPNIDFGEFEGCRKYLLATGFIKAKQAIDAVESFVTVVVRTDKKELSAAEEELSTEEMIEGVISDKEKELLDLLKPGYVLCGELSQFMAGNEYQKNSLHIRDVIRQELEKGTNFLAQHIETEMMDLKKQLKESGTSRQRKQAILSELHKDGGSENYVTCLPTETGIGVDVLNLSEKKIREEYLSKKNDYRLFIYTRNVFVKSGKELKSIQMDERIYKLLVIFLRHKDMLLPPIPLYRKAWVDAPEKVKNIEKDEDVTPYLTPAISELRSLLSSVPNFEITKARFQGYICKGNFKFCVIIRRHEEKKYILSEAQEQEAHTV